MACMATNDKMSEAKNFLKRHADNIFNKNRAGASPGERISFGAFWALTGTLSAQLSILLAGIVTARLLGKTAYGELGLLVSTIDALGVLAGLSLSVTLTKHLAETAATSPVRAGNILRMTRVFTAASGLAISAAVFFFSEQLAGRTFGAPNLAGTIKLCSPLVFLGAIYGLQNGALSGLEAFRRIAFINVAKAVWHLPLMLAGAYFFALNGAVAAMLISSAAGCLLGWFELKRETERLGIRAGDGPLISDPRMLLDFSLPSFLASLLYAPAIWIAGLMLAVSSGGYAALGVFSAANQWRSLMLFLPDMLSRAVMPVFASLLSSGNKTEARSLFIKLSLAVAVIAIPLALLVIVLSKIIMGLYGPQFSGGETALVLVTIAALLLALESPVGNIIAAAGKMWAGFAMNLGWAAALLLSAHFFIGRGWGATGLAAAYATAYAVHGIWTLAFLLKILGDTNPPDTAGERPEESWKKFWHGYDFDGNYDNTSRSVFEEISRATGGLSGLTALECGCGAGRISALMTSAGAQTSLLDCSEKALDMARRFFSLKGQKGTFVRGDIFALPFPDSSFDLVWSSGVLEHFTEAERGKAFSEMRRVAKPGGAIITVVPFSGGLIYRAGKFSAELRGIWPFGTEHPIRSMARPGGLSGLDLETEYDFGFRAQLSFLRFIPGAGIVGRLLGRLLAERPGRALFGGYLLFSKFRK